MVREKDCRHTKHFDEFILDDFFFTSCKSDIEIKAKVRRAGRIPFEADD